MLLRRFVAAALLPLLPIVTACSTMGAVRHPALFVTRKQPHVVWVTKTNNAVLPVARPRVFGDTLGGFIGRDYVQIPLDSVRSMRARQAAPLRTALLVGAAAVSLGAVIVAFSAGGTMVKPDTVGSDGTVGPSS
jgi:hypothetical protein